MDAIRLLAVMLLAAAAAPAWAGPTLDFASKDGVARMPFVFDSNHIYLEVRLANGKSGSFMVDTGADFTVLNASFARAAGIAASGRDSAHAAGGSVAMSKAGDQVFSLPGLTVEDGGVVVMDLDHLAPISGHRVDGILGNDVLGECAVSIDYAGRVITFYRRGSYQAPPQAVSLPLSSGFFSGAVFVPVTVMLPGHKPEEVKFAIDSGASYSSLNTPYVDSSGAIQAAGKTIARQAYGAGEERLVSLSGRISGLKLGPYLLVAPVLDLFRVKDGVFARSDFQGALGNDVLKRFTVTFDYPGKQLLLEPNPDIKTPFRTDASGLTLIAAGDDLGTYQVNTVTDGTPAADAGLKQGDVIEQVDGAPASRMSLGELKQLFTQDGRSLKLGVRRGVQRLALTLALRKLL